MSKSIISNEKECFVCGSKMALEKHHIYAGAFRNKSDRYGCWIWLCSYHHRLEGGVGYNNPIHWRDLEFRSMCQKKFEMLHSHKEFMQEFKIDYIEKEKLEKEK